jgi:hypothetical protein
MLVTSNFLKVSINGFKLVLLIFYKYLGRVL